MNELIPHLGNYKKLLTYRKAEVIYLITFYFCNKFLSKGDRTIDQMVQAARSGKQNIIEGSAAASTSALTEIKLLNVAKASLKELLEDYEDYLKTRRYEQWQPGSVEFEAMRRLGREHNDADYFMELIETLPPQTIANMAIILINQADYLLSDSSRGWRMILQTTAASRSACRESGKKNEATDPSHPRASTTVRTLKTLEAFGTLETLGTLGRARTQNGGRKGEN